MPFTPGVFWIIVLPIPRPFSIIFLKAGILMFAAHSHFPGGTMIVSPVLAESIAACTCSCEQLAALMVAAFTFDIDAALKAKTMNTNEIIIFFKSLSPLMQIKLPPNRHTGLIAVRLRTPACALQGISRRRPDEYPDGHASREPAIMIIMDSVLRNSIV